MPLDLSVISSPAVKHTSRRVNSSSPNISSWAVADVSSVLHGLCSLDLFDLPLQPLESPRLHWRTNPSSTCSSLRMSARSSAAFGWAVARQVRRLEVGEGVSGRWASPPGHHRTKLAVDGFGDHMLLRRHRGFH